MKRYLYILCITLASLCFPIPADAQMLRLSINPPLVEAVMKPGKSIVIAYTISNLGDPLILSADVRPFVPLGVNGDLALKGELEGPARFNLENTDIRLGQEFFLQSQEGQQLVLKIRIPDGTPEGDYYYTFFVENDLGKPTEGEPSAQTQARVGSNILITVSHSGNVEVNGSIGEFSVVPHWKVPFFGRTLNLFESTDIVPAKLIVQNTGQHLIKPQGTITLRGNFGEQAEYDILPQNVLSESSRLVSASPSAQMPSTYKGTASLFLSGFFVGKYTLTSHINFGDRTMEDIAAVHFYAFPIKLSFALLIAMIFGLIVVQKFRQDKP